MTDNGRTSLVGYIQAFERVNGRPPTEEENREALALVEVVRQSNLDPFLVYYLANKRAQDALDSAASRVEVASKVAAQPDATITTRFDRIEALLAKMRSPRDRFYRDAWAFVVALLFLVAATLIGNAEHTPGALYLLGGAAIGGLLMVVYLFFAPMVKR